MKKTTKAAAPVQSAVASTSAVKPVERTLELYDLRKGGTHTLMLGTDFKVVIGKWTGWSKVRKGVVDYSNIYHTYYKRDAASTIDNPVWVKVLVTKAGAKDANLWIGKDLKRSEPDVTKVVATQL